MAVTIRRAGVDDAKVLARVGAALVEQTCEGSIPFAELAVHIEQDFGEAQQHAELSAPDIVSLLVQEDQETVGFAQLRLRSIPVSGDAPENVELWRIYVDQRMHGSGVGKTLLKAIGVIARELDASGIWLAVWEKNPRAVSFYSRHSFVEVGREDFHVGGIVHHDFVMRAPADSF